jgi:2'-5' RNA ligase
MAVKTHKTAVVLIPPQERWEPIQTIRRRHDRHLRRWMPHVTLIYPFRPREQFDEVEPSLGEACGRVASFEVRLAEFRHFDHGRERFTLWLAPEPRDSLAVLQTALQSAVPGCDDVSRHPDGFTPHLSVGQVSGRDAMVALKTTLQASWQPLTFSARRVSLIWRADKPDDVFRVDRHIVFGQ